MVPLRVGVLGPVTLWRDGLEVKAGQPKQLAVLGVLASQANRVVPLEQLVDAIWGENPPTSAEGGIYTYVAGLRRVLEPGRGGGEARRGRRGPGGVLVSSGGGYLLRLEPGGLDAARFEERLAAGRRLREAGDLSQAASLLNEALALWRGTPYTGVPGPFATAERHRLTELRTAATERQADLMLCQGQHAAAVPGLTALVAEHPLRESACGLLMIALYRCGRQAEALRVFHDARQRLAADLGIDPGSELTRIHQQLLEMDPALNAPAQSVPLTMPEPGPDGRAAAGPPEPGDAGHGPAADSGPGPAGPSSPLAGGAASSRPSPAQLPPEPPTFAGRAAELAWLHALSPAGAAPGAAPPRPVSPIALITGTAGVGKTTLAIRFAREAGERFPDGQLYVNLRGFDPAAAPMSPATALQWFFDALGLPAMRVPSDLDARSALLRTLLDGKRMLLLLDNAHDADQVRPLLPGSPGCMVLVTSRSQLTGLVVAGARPLPLPVLDPREAAELVAGRLGAERTAAESAAVSALVEQSAGLPLALNVTCARAETRPAMRLADLAAELADTRGRLDALRTGEETTDLRAVFSWSADKLSEAGALMFHLLGLHTGPDIAVAAAASLAGVSRPAARGALAELTRASLLNEDGAGRFSCHDLLRAYAAEQAAQTLSPAERDLATRRVLDHYLHSAHAAAGRLYPAHGLVPLPAPAAGVTAEEFPGPDGYDAALAWFSAEHAVLGNLIEQAADGRHDEHCWKLAWYWAPSLDRRGRLHELLAGQRTAALAAGRLGDRAALGHVHCVLGTVNGRLGDPQAAEEHLRQAVDLFADSADAGVQASLGYARYCLVTLLSRPGRYEEALDEAMEALRVRRQLGDQAAVAYSENSVGWILAHLGQPDTALWYCRRALAMHREADCRTGIADTLDSIAYAYRQLGDFGQAVEHYEQALEMLRLLGDTRQEAASRLDLGDAQHAAGQRAAARSSYERALALLRQVPGADLSEVSGRLRTVG